MQSSVTPVQTLGNVKRRPLRSRNIPKFPRRNGSFLARSAIRRMADGGACARLQPEFVLCTLAFAGWIAVSDGLINRNGNRSGPTSPLSMPLQSALALLLATSLAWLWHSDAAFELKAAALATGSLLATPLCARLRHRRAGSRDRIFRATWVAIRLCRFRDQRAGRGLDRAAAGARRCRCHRRAAWPDRAADAVWILCCAAPGWIAPLQTTRQRTAKRDPNCPCVLIESFCARAVR